MNDILYNCREFNYSRYLYNSVFNLSYVGYFNYLLYMTLDWNFNLYYFWNYCLCIVYNLDYSRHFNDNIYYSLYFNLYFILYYSYLSLYLLYSWNLDYSLNRNLDYSLNRDISLNNVLDLY